MEGGNPRYRDSDRTRKEEESLSTQPISPSESTSSTISSPSLTTSSSSRSESFLCAQTCSACISNTKPSGSPPLPIDRQTGSKTSNRSKSVSVNKRFLELPDLYGGNTDQLLWNEYLKATWVPHSVAGYPPSSATFFALLDQPLSVVVEGLYECTSLVVMSTQGVWMSHMFESPWFQGQYNFRTQILDVLGPGDGTNGMLPGLYQLLGPGGAFGHETRPKAFITTPRNRFNPQRNIHMYSNMIQQLLAFVANLFRSCGSPLFANSANEAKAILVYDYIQNIHYFTPMTKHIHLRRQNLVSVRSCTKLLQRRTWIHAPMGTNETLVRR